MSQLPLLNRILKIIASLSAIFIGGIILLFLSADRNQMAKDRDYEQQLSPSIQFVQVFRANKGRLPSEKEFENRPSAPTDSVIDLVTADSADPTFTSHVGKTRQDFCLRIWRGEQWTYYFSWDGKFDIVGP